MNIVMQPAWTNPPDLKSFASFMKLCLTQRRVKSTVLLTSLLLHVRSDWEKMTFVRREDLVKLTLKFC
jgi:hypothetical protein